MPRAVVLRLVAEEDGYLDGWSGTGVQGFVLQEMQKSAPDLSASVHGLPGAYTVSPLMHVSGKYLHRERIQTGMQAWIRIAAIDERVCRWLETHWQGASPSPIFISKTQWAINDIAWSGSEHWGAGVATYAKLVEHQEGPSAWGLEFITPTTFHVANGETNLPFPLPELLLGSLVRNWNRYAPVRIPVEIATQMEGRLLVAAYNLKTVAQPTKHATLIGSVGTVRFDGKCLTSDERVKVSVLLQMAFWSGVGRYRSQGFGMVKPIFST